MQEYRKDEIIYDEDWKRFDEPSKAVVVDTNEDITSENREADKKAKEKRPVSLITIQLIICIIIVFVIFMLKSMDSDTYKNLSNWYNEQMRNTLVSSKTFEDIDLKKYFVETPDELSSTFDES